MSADDIALDSQSLFMGQEVVVTEKLDGECTTIYPDGYVHARSPDSKHHISRSWIKSHAQTFSWQIPDGWRICAENLTAWHSIFYTELPTYLFVIGIYEGDHCFNWDDTVDFCKEWKLTTVPVLWRGIWDEDVIRKLWTGKGMFPTFESKKTGFFFPEDFQPCPAEGYVVRLADSFYYDDFQKSVAKWVRPHHVTTDEHWLERFIPNHLYKPQTSQ